MHNRVTAPCVPVTPRIFNLWSDLCAVTSGAAKGGLAHEDAEEALCRASYTAGVLQMCPHMATKTHEQMAAARGKDQVCALYSMGV